VSDVLDAPAGIETPKAAYPGALLPLAEAAWASGLPRGVLTAAIVEGALRSHRLVLHGRVRAAIALSELEAWLRERGAAAEAPSPELAAAREELARMRGELAASERVERSLQRYADKLEERSDRRLGELEAALVESRRREMTLARHLGRAEERLERLGAPLGLAQGASPAPSGRPDAADA
jgi:hypothetical protein